MMTLKVKIRIQVAITAILFVALWYRQPLTVSAVEMYQEILSPHKGWDCGLGKIPGRLSCSAFGKKAIQDHGVLKGVLETRKRFGQCSKHAEEYHVLSEVP